MRVAGWDDYGMYLKYWNDPKAIASEVAAMDPICRSEEGLDDCCHFCGAGPPRWNDGSRESYIDNHDTDCVWIRANRFVGRPIGLHRVER